MVQNTGMNSGVMPGSGVKVYNLMDPKTGLPVSFEYFLDHLLVDAPSTSEAKEGTVTRRRLGRRGRPGDDLVDIRRVCIPQVSTHPLANPYHPDLTGRDEVNYLTGAGRPVLYPDSGMRCPPDSPSPCTYSFTREISYQNAIAYSVSDSKSNSLTKVIGGSSTQTDSSSVSDTVSHTLEKNWSESDAHTNERSIAHTFGDILTQGNSSSEQNVFIRGKGGDNATTLIENREDNGNWHKEGQGQASFSFLGLSFGGGGGGGEGGGWSNSTGKNTQDSTNWNEGSQNMTSKEDNWSKQTQNLTTDTQGSSDTHTSTTGGSDSLTNSHMVTNTVEFSVTKDWSTSRGTENSHGTQNTSTTTTITTKGSSWSFPIAPGQCRKAVCYPDSEMYILPFLCGDALTQTAERTYAAIAKIRQRGDNFGCFFVGLISCDDATQDSLPFLTYDDFLSTITPKNTLYVGSFLDSANPLVSTNGLFTATMDASGSLVVKRGDVRVWESGATPFVARPALNKYAHRARINMRGHLVIESQNIWSGVKPSYSPNTWVQTWSTQPIYQNYTVGTPRRADSPVDNYMLVLDDNGRLSLYDAAYVKIWCTFDNGNTPCRNSKGYKYQEEYLVPLDLETPEDPSGWGEVKDPHNSLLFNTRLLKEKSSIVSQDTQCSDALNSGEALVSPNGRYKVALYPDGNLVIKDGYRTMWSAYVANFPNTTAPYQLILTADGELVARDSTRRWYWLGKNAEEVLIPGPYQASILDTGEFLVTGKDGARVWSAWPHSGINLGRRVYADFRACYKPCGECPPETTTTLLAPTQTISTTTTTTLTTAPPLTPTPNMESIRDKCQGWMETYHIDPFLAWGDIQDNLDMQAQWVFYDCACFGAQMKYGIKALSTASDRWGTLTDPQIKDQWTKSTCDCPIQEDNYKVLPKPKDWGTLTNPTIQKRWTAMGCDADVNREPFIHNPDNGIPLTKTTVTGTTSLTTHSLTTPTPTQSPILTKIEGSLVQVVTATPTDYMTVGVTVGVTITALPPTATPTTAPICRGGQPGANTGVGKSGECCKSDADCQENCKGGKCGKCGVDFKC
jgi:hypothetical protein